MKEWVHQFNYRIEEQMKATSPAAKTIEYKCTLNKGTRWAEMKIIAVCFRTWPLSCIWDPVALLSLADQLPGKRKFITDIPHTYMRDTQGKMNSSLRWLRIQA